MTLDMKGSWEDNTTQRCEGSQKCYEIADGGGIENKEGNERIRK